MIRSFRHKGLAGLWNEGDARGVRNGPVDRIRQRLTALDAAHVALVPILEWRRQVFLKPLPPHTRHMPGGHPATVATSCRKAPLPVLGMPPR
jgi:hypothetical protein